MLEHSTYARRFNKDRRHRGRKRGGYDYGEDRDDIRRDGRNTGGLLSYDEQGDVAEYYEVSHTGDRQTVQARVQRNFVPDGSRGRFFK